MNVLKCNDFKEYEKIQIDRSKKNLDLINFQ